MVARPAGTSLQPVYLAKKKTSVVLLACS
jgi:hypothetical protein